MRRLINLGCLFLSFFSINSYAAMLSGNVSFDDVTDLYTYTYILDTTDFVGNIAIVDILASKYNLLPPVSHTEPDGWDFVVSSGSIGTAPFGSQFRINGAFWGWWKNTVDNATYSDIQTFSFSTERSITTSIEKNYGLFNSVIGTSSYIEDGRIVGPDFLYIPPVPVSPVPENETYAMMIAGLGLLGFIGRRRLKGQS